MAIRLGLIASASGGGSGTVSGTAGSRLRTRRASSVGKETRFSRIRLQNLFKGQ